MTYLTDRRAPKTTPPTFAALRGSRETSQMALATPLGGALGLRLEASYALHRFDAPFEDAGSSEWASAAGGTWRPLRRFEFGAWYQHAGVASKGRDSGDPAGLGDGSYLRDLLQTTISFAPRRPVARVRRVTLTARREVYRYTTGQTPAEDPAHAGRKDAIDAAELKVASAPLLDDLTLEAGWRRAWTASTRAGAVANPARDAPSTEDHSDNRIWLGVTYTLGARP